MRRGVRDAIGQVGDDACRRRQAEGAIVDLTRIGGDNVEPAQDRAVGHIPQGGEAALVLLDGDDAGRAFDKQRSGQAARPGPDFDDGRSFERSCGAGDAAGEIEIEQEVLTEALAALKARTRG